MSRERIGRKAEVARQMRFLELLPGSRNVAEAYLAAGFHAKNEDIARQNGCHLLRRLDKKTGYREIMDQIGLTDRHVAGKILDVVDDEDKHVSVKGLNLATRCKGWQQPNVNIGIGMQIVITNQLGHQAGVQDDQAIDVTAISQPNKDDTEQILD